MRRSACLTVALAVLVSLTLAAGAAGATVDPGGAYVPTARAEDPGDSEDDGGKAERTRKGQKAEEPENCPQELWVIALPVEGLACVLLLPKPLEEEEEEEEEGKRGEGRGRAEQAVTLLQ